jgi:hypothetical protein
MIKNPKPIWTKSKWKKSDLDGKSVEFCLTSGTQQVSGVGKFVIGGPNPKGLLFVMIEVISQGRHWSEFLQTRFYLPQGYVDKIRPHPTSSDPDPEKKIDFVV